jgi:Zn-dependent M28 family amino/carboxypeptidase
MNRKRFLAAVFAAIAAGGAAAQVQPKVTANDLRADVSFLASDALEGRGTPSKGLDIAAEYIASEFRRAGLEPAGDDGYFQTADFNSALLLVPPGTSVRNSSARIPTVPQQPVKLRNVIGVLRGSDPALKDTYLVLTAHYDHLGVRGTGEGDHIYNGANDDASGTSSVIEIAKTLAALPQRPRRSIVFMTLFGEELGELGSRYYCQHPVFPLAKTVADINLEQLGRTDDTEGPRLLQFNLTGFDYTDIATFLGKAGEETGIRAVKHLENSDSFFGRSDNAAFADAGVPSTTLSVSYIFPDYHRPGDEWSKLDYDNMAKVDDAVALGVFRIADSVEAPQWNKANPKTARYVEARENAGPAAKGQ